MPRKALHEKQKKGQRPFIHGHLIHVRYMEAVPKRANLVAQYLGTLKETFGVLLADENFVTLLRAESMTRVPVYFQPLLKEENS
jgi:hypothetical protein